jgi:hypothetical protein
VFIDGESKRPCLIRLGGKKQSSSAATSPVLGRSGVAILLTALDGKGWRDGASKVREGASTARDGEGRHDGYTTAMDGATARRLHDGQGRRGATAMGCGDGSSKARPTAMGCGDGSSKAREGASTARDGVTHDDGQGWRGICAQGK